MYYLIKAKDVVRVPPNKIGENLEKAIYTELGNALIGQIIEIGLEKGTIIGIKEINEIGEGKIIHGDAGVYFDVVFTGVMAIPKIQEIVQGEVKSIKNFGAFIDIGTFDGFCHVSQVFDDYVSFDEANKMFNGKDTGIYLKEGDNVIARITNLSIKTTMFDAKIGLTMRQPFLGKPEWINAKKKEIKKEDEKKDKSKEIKSEETKTPKSKTPKRIRE